MIRKSLSNSNSSERASDEEEDTHSVVTSDSESNEVVLTDDINLEKPTFGNIQVQNSSDIYFGNTTYYQGPITIKQILYGPTEAGTDKNNALVLDNVPAIASLSKDNPIFVPDNNVSRIKTESAKINAEPQRTPVIKGTRWLQNFSRQHVLLFSSLAAVLLVSLVTLMTVLLTRHQPVDKFPQYPSDSDEQDKGTPIEYPVDANTTVPEKLTIISREKWSANPPKEKPDPLDLPVPYVIIMHTATEFCTDLESCIFHVQTIQKFHVDSRHWDDIGYSFLVGGDGYAYEGRGWYAIGAQVYGYNNKCIGIAFIGTFEQTLPPKKQILAAKRLIQMGVNNSVIAPNYKLLAARQLQTTQSPGELLYEDIKTWGHWSPTP